MCNTLPKNWDFDIIKNLNLIHHNHAIFFIQKIKDAKYRECVWGS